MLYGIVDVHFFFFFPQLLSGTYLWNRYSQRLQIECAAWSCCLILHYSLPSNSLRYLFFFHFYRHDFVVAISLEPSLVETPDWVCCLVLRSNFALLLTIQFASWFFFYFFFFFPPRFCPGHISGTVTRRDSKLSVLLGPAVSFCTVAYHPIRFVIFCFFYFFCFFRHDFVRAISLEPLLAETPNWVCCLVLRSNFALLFTIQFASLISSLINIISQLLTTLVFHLRGIAPRLHTDRPRTCLVISILWKY